MESTHVRMSTLPVSYQQANEALTAGQRVVVHRAPLYCVTSDDPANLRVRAGTVATGCPEPVFVITGAEPIPRVWQSDHLTDGEAQALIDAGAIDERNSQLSIVNEIEIEQRHRAQRVGS